MVEDESTSSLLSEDKNAEHGGSSGKQSHVLQLKEQQQQQQQQQQEKDEEEDDEPGPEPSATPFLSALLHLFIFLFTCIILRTLLLLDVFEDDPVAPAVFLLFICGAANIIIDVRCYNVHKRPSTGLDFSKPPSPALGRAGIKCLGVLGSFSMLFFFYWVLPEYHMGDFYDNYYAMLWTVLPPLVPFAALYIYYVDSYMTHPRDGYFHMGMLVIGRWEFVNTQVLWQHVLGWIVKGFFLPLMFVPLCQDVQHLLTRNFRDFDTWGHWYNYCYSFLYFVDLHFATIGYITTFRLCDSHIRATEPTVLGWLVALMCYSPVNTVTGYYFGYESDMDWQEWLAPYPILSFFWGSTIIILTALYTLAAVSFGIRFSNLTHRGIITTGPYALTKHPAYLFKNLSWWMTNIPFAVSSGSLVAAFRNCVGLVMFNGIYLLRARCEEALLSQDPSYVRYCRHMDKHGMFASISEQLRRSASVGFGSAMGIVPPGTRRESPRERSSDE